MNAFRSALSAIRPSAFRPPRLPAVPMVAASVARIPALGIDMPEPSPAKNYDRIAEQLAGKIRARQQLDKTEARDGAWCLWTTKPALAERLDTLTAVLRGIEQHDRPRLYRALGSSWLSSFARGRPGMPEASDLLTRRADRLGAKWSGLQSSLRLFSIDDGPRTVVLQARREHLSPIAKLQALGLSATDARSGFAKACVAEGLRGIAGDRDLDAGARITDVEGLALDDRAALLFSDQGDLVARALLAPYASAVPSKTIRDRTLSLLIGLFSDPRLNAGRWVAMQDCEAIVRRWLTEQSLRQFLDIVDRVADKHMWKYRRAFWEAVQRAELISDAWVVFDPQGAELARRTFGKTVSFGTFAGGAANGQAVMLLRVGRGIIAEWSHSGRCNMWRDSHELGAPALNKSQYSGNALRGLHSRNDPQGHWSFEAYAHMGSATYAWQHKVAAKLRDMTNYNLSPESYKLR